MKRKKIIIPSILFLAVAPISVLITSCSDVKEVPITNFFNATLKNEKYIDLYKLVNDTTKSKNIFMKYSKELGLKYSGEWYSKLKNANWNYANPNNPVGIPLNLHCSTAKQALALYCNAWGDFWNIELHQNRIPIDKPNHYLKGNGVFPKQRLGILGKDYKYISESLTESSIPENTVAYHGVEFMEIEFWEQLKDFITENKNGTYDYSKCVGQTITSYGFISTSLDKEYVDEFSDGQDWVNGGNYKPLKEDFVFKIFIPKNIKGTAYVSWFNFMDTYDDEHQILIDRNSKFEIVNYYKDGKNNYFDLLFLGINDKDEIS
ncbi:MAG: ADP-ribosyltransferase [Ureaplasma sp.]|nr:ADP-ribosyltransferase [Ureaplasma sp.]